MHSVILASQSPQRKTLFATLGIPFLAVPADIDEKAIHDTDLAKRAEKIAIAKAEKVAQDNPSSIVVAADTYLIHNDRAMEKPESVAEAKSMLQSFSGKELQEVTGVCYLDAKHHIHHSEVVVVSFTFRKLTETEIDTYISQQPVTTWSGAFCPAYPEGAGLIASLQGSFTGFTHGLPIEVIVPLLKKSGITL